MSLKAETTDKIKINYKLQTEAPCLSLPETTTSAWATRTKGCMSQAKSLFNSKFSHNKFEKMSANKNKTCFITIFNGHSYKSLNLEI